MPVPNLSPILAVVLAFLPLFAVQGGEAKPAAKDAKADPAVKPDASDAIDSMCKMIPEGRRNLKVHYPGFDSGRASSLVTALAMTRVNPQEMFAEKLRIDLYGKEAKDNMRVDLKTGTYHMDTKMLISNDRSHVSRSDFKIDGDGMEFDMTSSQGKMIGNVKMVIYDSSSFSAQKADKPEQPQTVEQPATPAPAKEPSPPPGK
ncbi:MAG: hypothetical protein JWO94_2853 [Verrucomicrobiaceae bacterium]|nr:hypothetical protein [Verrucomicrobiaceae bacterium]